MIDIHSHLLFGVDDGPTEIEESVQMLKEAAKQGVSAMILTPHYRHGMFPYNKEKIKRHYEELLPYAKKVGIRLYLGCEYHVNSRIVEALASERVLSMADSSYVLTEYEYETDYEYIEKMTQKLISHGYIPVIAHVERYRCLLKTPAYIEQLRRLGAWVQINADAVLGLDGGVSKRFCKKILKQGWVDVIGSDSHGIKQRACHLGKCQEYLRKKYDERFVAKLLSKNPQKILEEE